MQTVHELNKSEIKTTKEPDKNYDVIKESALDDSEKVTAKTAELQYWMQKQRLIVTGSPELARYNPPWTLPFMRRNEIMIAYQPK